MNSSTDLRVQRSLRLAHSLKTVAEDFAQRESALSREIGARRLAETRKFREEQSRLETWLATESARADTLFEERKAQVEQRAASRKARIERAHRSGLENLQEQARAAKDRWLGNLQMRHFRATRSLPLDLKAADEAFADYSSKLGGWQAAVAALERKVRGAFRGYWSFGKLIKDDSASLAAEPQDRFVLFANLQQAYRETEDRLVEFRKIEIPRYFSLLPPMLLIPLLVAVPLVAYLTGSSALLTLGSTAADIVLLGATFVLHQKGGRQAQAAAETLAVALVRAKGLAQLCREVATRQYEEKRERLQRDYDQLCAELTEKWEQGEAIESRFAVEIRAKIEAQAPRSLQRNEEWRVRALEDNLRLYEERQQEIAARVEPWRTQITNGYAAESSALQVEEEARWTELRAAWDGAITPLTAEIEEMQQAAAETSSPWDAAAVEMWTPPATFSTAIQVGALEVDLSTTPHPRDPRLPLPEPATIGIPLALSFPAQGSLLFETSESGAPEAAAAFNNVILRLLTHTPPGKLSFTILDPVGLGQNFAGLMHLTDFEESLINRRIWTQREQIEERLAELNEHIEKVIQMYLRNEYETITEYNAQAGSVAEKYHFLVVADFPANFSETAAKRLQSIVTSGPSAGSLPFCIGIAARLCPMGSCRRNCAKMPSASAAITIAGFSRRKRSSRMPWWLWTRRRGMNWPSSWYTRSAKAVLTPIAWRCRLPRSRQGRRSCGRVTPRASSRLPSAHRGDEAPVSLDRQGDPPARALCWKNRFRQVDAVSRHHHKPLALVQPRAGGVLPDRFQERRRVQVLRGAPPASCQGGGH